MTIAVLGSVLMFLSLKLDKVEDISVTSQISEIENMQESVKNLGLFLEYKKSEIYETNKLINELKDEQAIFDSIAKVDEQTIEHILAIHQKANRLNRWKETGIAFILGIISSIFGGHILESIKKK